MYRELSKLVVYKNIDSDSVLFNLGRIFKTFKENNYDKECLIEEIYSQIHRILEISTKYAFDTNLWHNYLAFLLATTENPFSMTCEKVGAKDGSVNSFAKGDFKIFKNLFDYDFSEIEKTLEINCFSIILNYKSIEKSEHRYNKSVSEKVKQLSFEIENAKDENQIFEIVTTFYKLFGVGKFGLNKAFRIVNESINADVELVPITNTVEVHLSDLVGYELQKKKLVDNTVAFIDGKKANNVLLFGDSGTGKCYSKRVLWTRFKNYRNIQTPI